MAQSTVELNPFKNFKIGNTKLMNKGLPTVIKLLVVAIAVYGLWQLLVMFVAGDSLNEFETELRKLESDPNNFLLIKDSLLELAKKTGIVVVFSAAILTLLNGVYGISTLRVYINSIRGKDTSLDTSIRFGLQRFGVALRFYLLVTAMIFGYFALVGLFGSILPFSLFILIPLGVVLFVMLIIRLLFSSEIIADDKKPKVMRIFETSKDLVDGNGPAVAYYILFGVGAIVLTSALTKLVANSFGLYTSDSYSLLTNYRDILYTTISFTTSSVVSFFLTAGWVEIYNQAKLETEPLLSGKKNLKK